jgi:hypothetical protein
LQYHHILFLTPGCEFLQCGWVGEYEKRKPKGTAKKHLSEHLVRILSPGGFLKKNKKTNKLRFWSSRKGL